LFPWRTALGNVSFGLEMKGVPKDEREKIAREQLRLVKLEKFTASFPHHLSGGMQQRVAIARALAYNPSVLLMDEPFAALDALTRDDMQRLLAEVWRETRKTVIYVTHSLEDLWGVDEGLELYGSFGKVSYAVAVQNGGVPGARDYNSDKSVAGRISYDPNRWLHLSVSAMRTGDLDVNGDGVLNVNDIFYQINFLFAGGAAPACY